MARFLSVLATLLMVAIVQVYAAINPPSGVYSIALGRYFLTAEHARPDAAVFLSAECEDLSQWMLYPHRDGRYAIVDAKRGFSLDYKHREEGSRLILSTEDVRWELRKNDNGEVEIRVPHSDLVIGMIPSHDFVPMVGLTQPGKAPHSWKLDYIRPEDQSEVVSHRDVQIILHNRMYLTEIEPHRAVRLMSDVGRGSVWTIEEHNSKMSIKNRRSGLYLTYDPESPHAPMKTSKNPSYFTTEKVGPNSMMILAAERIDGKHLALSELPYRVFPPLVGLMPPTKSEDELWRIRHIGGLDDDREQISFW
ncbi:hypothetical protein BGW41_003406 [Actinomortierella wolfii]|nr:hypothetical protein BGW41_003406 [Actinomortierella wolfii]